MLKNTTEDTFPSWGGRRVPDKVASKKLDRKWKVNSHLSSQVQQEEQYKTKKLDNAQDSAGVEVDNDPFPSYAHVVNISKYCNHHANKNIFISKRLKPIGKVRKLSLMGI